MRENYDLYPKCLSPLLEMDNRRAEKLLRWLASRTASPHDPRMNAAVGVVLERLTCDGQRYSEIFEPSLSFSAGRWQVMRFSYAFPGYLREWEKTASAIRRFVKPFGEKPRSAVEIFLSHLDHRSVSQPLLGLDFEGAKDWRIKLYLQLNDEADPSWSYELASRLLSLSHPERHLRGRQLHMIGLDIEGGGLAGAKLYVRPVAGSTDIRMLRSSPRLSRLLPAGFGNWNDFLLIHRLRCADDPNGTTPVEMDFSLANNGFHADAMCRHPALVDLLVAGPWRQLEKRFSAVARRFSLHLAREDRLNLYFVLGDGRAA